MRQSRIENIELKELSMGMSSDYKIAIEEGATFEGLCNMIGAEASEESSHPNIESEVDNEIEK